MSIEINEPSQRLSKNAVKVWLISNAITNIIGIITLIIMFYLQSYYKWYEWVWSVLILITILVVIGTIWSFVKPFLLYKNWRYDVNEEFLQLKFGALNEEYRLVPMTKIQSVATRQGPLLRMYSLYTVTVDTMGTTHTIPALPEEVGIKLRNEIAQYAKIREVE